MGRLKSARNGTASPPPPLTPEEMNDKAAIEASSMVLVGAIKQQLNKPGTGRLRQGETKRLGRGAIRSKRGTNGDRIHVVVKRGNPRTKIQGATRASAPGEPPAPDTHQLGLSIQFEWNGDAREGYVGSGLPQAPALNNGTTNAGRGHKTVIAPRPFMEPGRASCESQMTDACVLTLNSKAGDITQQNGPAFAGPAGGGQRV